MAIEEGKTIKGMAWLEWVLEKGKVPVEDRKREKEMDSGRKRRPRRDRLGRE